MAIVRETAILARGLVRETDELLSRVLGGVNAAWQRQSRRPRSRATRSKPFGIDAGHAPARRFRLRRQAPKPCAYSCDGVGMVVVHMRDDALLGLDERLGALPEASRRSAGLQIDDAAEAADVMGALDLEPPEGESPGNRRKTRPPAGAPGSGAAPPRLPSSRPGRESVSARALQRIARPRRRSRRPGSRRADRARGSRCAGPASKSGISGRRRGRSPA